MAKVIRPQWVYKIGGHKYKYLPRRNEGAKRYDYEGNEAGPDHFPEKIEGAPPKLWLAWIYRDTSNQPRWVKDWLKRLFGENYQPGKMNVFKNTPSQNRELWNVKHMIDLKPMTFPDGEPTKDDIFSIEVFPDGRCVIDKKIGPSNQLPTEYIDSTKQFSSGSLCHELNRRYHSYRDIFEDNVYNPGNMSVID